MLFRVHGYFKCIYILGIPIFYMTVMIVFIYIHIIFISNYILLSNSTYQYNHILLEGEICTKYIF